MAHRVVLRMLLAGASVASMVSTTHADDSASLKPEGLYMCMQNANMTGSVWHPAECSRFAVIEDQIADRSSQAVVQFDHTDSNMMGGTDIWWKVDFRGVGQVTDKTTHWFCSDHGSGFSCVWQTTNNAKDWEAYNQFRVMGVADIPSVFWVPQSLVEHYATLKPLVQRRATNEARYAKAETLAKSDVYTWSYVPTDGGACRILGPTTPFEFMQSISAKRHHSSVGWDADIGDNDGGRSVVADNNDPTVPLKAGPVQEYRFYISVDECNAALARSLPHKGMAVSDADLQHKPAVKWVITDDTVSGKVACHWPSVVTGNSPKDFLAILKEQGATITEVSPNTVSTEDNRTSFEISFAYTLKGHTNQISWSDLGNYGCVPGVKDRLQLP
jgi:hypothetical protein